MLKCIYATLLLIHGPLSGLMSVDLTSTFDASMGEQELASEQLFLSQIVAAKNGSICAAMSNEGFLHYSHLSGAFNAMRFCEFLESLFAILYSRGRCGCWIVLDNVRFHHCAEVIQTATPSCPHAHILTSILTNVESNKILTWKVENLHEDTRCQLHSTSTQNEFIILKAANIIGRLSWMDSRC